MNIVECFTADRAAKQSGRAPGLREIVRRLVLNPGFRAVVHYRLACYFRRLQFPRRTTNLIAALLLARLNRVPGVEIHADAEIAPGLHIPHPHDIVIGAGSRIGRQVTIYNGVTLGARDLMARDAEQDTADRYPTIGDGVTLFTGAKILGPVHIGQNSVVGANSVVLQSFPEDSVLVGIPARNVARSEDPAPGAS